MDLDDDPSPQKKPGRNISDQSVSDLDFHSAGDSDGDEDSDVGPINFNEIQYQNGSRGSHSTPTKGTVKKVRTQQKGVPSRAKQTGFPNKTGTLTLQNSKPVKKTKVSKQKLPASSMASSNAMKQQPLSSGKAESSAKTTAADNARVLANANESLKSSMSMNGIVKKEMHGELLKLLQKKPEAAIEKQSASSGSSNAKSNSTLSSSLLQVANELSTTPNVSRSRTPSVVLNFATNPQNVKAAQANKHSCSQTLSGIKPLTQAKAASSKSERPSRSLRLSHPPTSNHRTPDINAEEKFHSSNPRATSVLLTPSTNLPDIAVHPDLKTQNHRLQVTTVQPDPTSMELDQPA